MQLLLKGPENVSYKEGRATGDVRFLTGFEYSVWISYGNLALIRPLGALIRPAGP